MVRERVKLKNILGSKGGYPYSFLPMYLQLLCHSCAIEISILRGCEFESKYPIRIAIQSSDC